MDILGNLAGDARRAGDACLAAGYLAGWQRPVIPVRTATGRTLTPIKSSGFAIVFTP